MTPLRASHVSTHLHLLRADLDFGTEHHSVGDSAEFDSERFAKLLEAVDVRFLELAFPAIAEE